MQSVVIGTASVSASGATATSIPFAPEPGPFANGGPACDDCVSTGLPIGFSFRFFDNSYTTFNLSSNGFVQFGSSTSNGCCSGRPIPSADEPNNIIAAAWTDLYPHAAGMISFETRGRAPSRFLVVNFQNVPWCCEAGENRVSTQIILYEGTNAIEIHTANQSAGHIYTQGIEDESGTKASFLSGRVASNYGLSNDAVRFTTTPSWMARAPLPSARRGLALWDSQGLLYAIGGSNSAGTVLRTVQAYNPGTNMWSSKAPLPAPRQTGNGAGEINGIIYLAGGHDAAGALTRTLYAYNPSTNTWSTKTQMPIFSSCGGTAVFAGKLYVFSGCTR
ncbi:MAG TPA: kelch repeat-containing protein, partial [Gemmatimonadales bacterium]